MKIEIFDSYKKISRRAASIVAKEILKKENSVLGFATGSSPIGTYSTLIKMYEYGIFLKSQGRIEEARKILTDAKEMYLDTKMILYVNKTSRALEDI